MKCIKDIFKNLIYILALRNNQMFSIKKIFFPTIFIFLLQFSNYLRAEQLTIDVIGSSNNQIPIAISQFQNEENFKTVASKVILNDLKSTGLFSINNIENLNSPFDSTEIDFQTLADNGVMHVLVGKMELLENKKIKLRFRLFDVPRQKQTLGLSYTISERSIRLASHRISDKIYEEITGDLGIFSTKISYVLNKGNIFELIVADYDGYNPIVVHRYNEPIISPKWSPDGKSIAYVSFEKKKALLYIYEIYTGKRFLLAAYEGSNSAPAWHPNGNELAMALTKDGNSEIYTINKDGSNLRRLTNSQYIETEPYYSSDGKELIFVSDRSGGPQIYNMNLKTKKIKRLTFAGGYNVTPRLLKNDKSFVFVHQINGNFNVAIQDISTGTVQLLTDGKSDQSPALAPNDRIILYASQKKDKHILAAVSVDGRVRQEITIQNGDIREPSWGPIRRFK